MATYQFLCDKDDGGCGHVIELRCLISELDEQKPKSCPKCRKRKPPRQLYGLSSMHIPHTLGSHVDKQDGKMSDDEKHSLTEKHNEYRKKDGPSWVEVDGRPVHRSNLND